MPGRSCRTINLLHWQGVFIEGHGLRGRREAFYSIFRRSSAILFALFLYHMSSQRLGGEFVIIAELDCFDRHFLDVVKPEVFIESR
jgi:hypothetical protein